MLDTLGTSWIQKGQPILPLPPGFSIPTLSGSIQQQQSTISISDDGNTVAGVIVGNIDGVLREFAIVYDFISTSMWTIRGSIIYTSPIEIGNTPVRHHNHISLSGDGNSFAFAHSPDIFVPTVNITAQVYDWNGLDWEKRGNSQLLVSTIRAFINEPLVEPIDIKLSHDKNHFLVGYYDTSNDVSPISTVVFKVFEWNGVDWQQKGQNVTKQFLIDGTVLRDNGLDISPTGDIAFMIDVYDWNESLDQWIQRPEIPNIISGQETVYAMSQDGNFVINSPDFTQIQIVEWKSFQNEWVICQNVSIPVNSLLWNLFKFSRDGMHFITLEISSTSLHPSTGTSVFNTYDFLN